jgi:hypothetical protein
VARGGGPVGLVLDTLDQEAARSGLGEGFITAARVTRRALHWQQGAEGPHLLLGLMRWLAAREQPQLLGWVLRRCEAPLRADDRCWGEASYALCSLHEFRAVVRWLHDWPQRERAPSYAMANLGGSLVVLRQWDALQAAVQQTLQRLPEQEDMRLWQLLLHARAGDLPALQAALQRCHEWTPDPWMRPLLKATEAYVALALARAEGGTVAALLATAPHGGPPQAWAMWRELRRMALLRHTPWPRLGRWLLAG